MRKMSDPKDSDVPPSYNEVMSAPLNLPPPEVQQEKHEAPLDHRVPIPAEVNNVRQAVVFNDMAQFVDCRSCFRQVTTEVTSEVSPRGWMWAIVCCLFGSWILSYLVNCFPGFRRYTYTCPKCRTIIAQTEPKHTTCQFVTIMLTSIGVIGLVVLGLFIYYSGQKNY